MKALFFAALVVTGSAFGASRLASYDEAAMFCRAVPQVLYHKGALSNIKFGDCMMESIKVIETNKGETILRGHVSSYGSTCEIHLVDGQADLYDKSECF